MGRRYHAVVAPNAGAGVPEDVRTLGNRIVMGDDFVERVRNVGHNQKEGRLVSTFLLAERT